MYSFHFSVAFKFSSGLVFGAAWIHMTYYSSIAFFFPSSYHRFYSLIEFLPHFAHTNEFVSISLFIFNLLIFSWFTHSPPRIRNKYLYIEEKKLYYLIILKYTNLLKHYIASAHLFVSFTIEWTFRSSLFLLTIITLIMYNNFHFRNCCLEQFWI